ncbi:hypothetical protein HOH15_03655, partial [Candidatus Woesearchaeota archaeon]|nr:hypothetical protein [Candidatus Woesearchaeota archaeon]
MIKKRLIIVVFLIIALFSVNVSGECIIPENGMITTQDITLCYDEYLLPYGLVISGGDVTLDCNKAKIKGYGFGEGISIIGAGNVKIINCIVENYEHGIYLEDSFNNEISNNELIENNIGIAMSNSEGNVILNNVDKSIEGAILVYDETVIEEPKTIEEEIPSEKEASA